MTSVLDVISIRRMPTGRRRYALQGVKEVADPTRDAEIIALCDEGLAHDEQTAALQAARAKQGRSPRPVAGEASRAQQLDARIDRTLSAIDRKIEDELEAYDPQTDAAEIARLNEVRATLFPAGVGAIARSSHVEALSLVQGVIERAEPHLTLLASVGAGRLLQRLGALLPQFEAAVRNETPGEVSSSEVRAATNKGNRLLHDVVVAILHQTRNEDDPAVMAQRQTLLAPILEQDRTMFHYNRQNRRPSDVDPSTGQEVDTPPEDD